MSDSFEDLDALFDQISAQHAEIAVTVSDAPPSAVQVSEAAPEGLAEAEKPMYERLGGIVRILHDSIRELGQQHPFNTLNTQIGDAQATDFADANQQPGADAQGAEANAGQHRSGDVEYPRQGSVVLQAQAQQQQVEQLVGVVGCRSRHT